MSTNDVDDVAPHMGARVAHRHGVALPALDADVNRIADVVGIELDQASRRA